MRSSPRHETGVHHAVASLESVNSDFIVEQAAFIAERAQRDTEGQDLEAAVQRCFALALTREPDREELAAATRTAELHGLAVLCRSLVNANEFAFLR